MSDAIAIARRILDLSEPVMLSTGESVALATKVVELTDRLEKLRRIRARITTLSLAANLPPCVWSELCHLDSEMSVLLKETPND